MMMMMKSSGLIDLAMEVHRIHCQKTANKLGKLPTLKTFKEDWFETVFES